MQRILSSMALLVFSVPAIAQGDHGESAGPYYELVDVLQPMNAIKPAVERLIEVEIPAALLRDPNVAVTEKECPGSVKTMLQASEPIIQEIALDGHIEFRERLVTLFSETFTEDEARDMAAMFSTPLAQRSLKVARQTNGMTAQLNSAMESEDGDISRKAFDADLATTKQTINDSLTSSEAAQLNFQLQTSAWYSKFREIEPRINDLRYEITNAPYSPEQDAAVEEAMVGALDAYLTKCLDGLEKLD